MKEIIMKIIEKDPITKSIYDNNEGCFRNIVVPRLTECNNDSMLEVVISMLATQSLLYDTLLNNISVLGSEALIKKCNKDIQTIFSSEE